MHWMKLIACLMCMQCAKDKTEKERQNLVNSRKALNEWCKTGELNLHVP